MKDPVVLYVCMNNQIERPMKTWTHRGDNRDRLIAAGYEILAEKGVEATTVKEIAQRANVSPGLFHYYFTSKDELLLAVLQEAGERLKKRILQELHTGGSAARFFAMALEIAQASSKQEITWYRLRYELYALGLRKPAFRLALGEFLAAVRSTVAHTIQEFLGKDEREAQAIAAVILACFDGLALQQITQPELDLSEAYKLLHQLVVFDHPSER